MENSLERESGLVSWCNSCNTPLIGATECTLCSGPTRGFGLKNGELRPVFEPEKARYNKIINKSRGINDDLLPSEPTQKSFISRSNIFVDGRKVFRVYFSRKEGWKATSYEDIVVGDLVGSNVRELIKANKKQLKEKEKEAVGFIKECFGGFGLPKVVSFSGGKDSLVTLLLARKIKRNIPVVYLNTSLDFPETTEYVRKLKGDLKLNLIEITPPQTFFELSRKLGPPSCFAPWCCQTLKFGPFNRFIEDYYPEGVLSFQGLRKFESATRKNYDRIVFNSTIPKQKIACPILDWTTFEVWLYILWKRAEYNPVYDYGFPRVGCVVCPHKYINHFKLTEETHPKIMKRWYRILHDYAKENGYDASWVTSGNWSKRCEKFQKIPLKFFRTYEFEGSKFYEIKNEKMFSQVKEYLKVFKNFEVRTNEKLEITFSDNKIEVRTNPKILKKVDKQILRAINCVGCGACTGFCSAMRIERGRLKIDDKKCTSCLKCLSSANLRMSCVSLNYRKKRFIPSDEKLTNVSNVC